ncbi:MAG: translation initiation factor IF-2 [bacterium]|nr:translation initiation factor IF-2 [bacterium]
MRVYELAKKLGCPSKQMALELRELGIEVKSYMSSITAEAAQEVLDLYAKKPAAPPPLLKEISITDPITIGELAPKLELSPANLIKNLLDQGKTYTINQHLSGELAKEIAEGYGFKVKEVIPLEEVEMSLVEEAEAAEDLKPRPPIVTIMGHVDHGKTKLLDAIRTTDVVAGEAGGITQHIGAYKVRVNQGEVTFLDTPGHEAFTAMRARGAQVTDIVVLVVAADDGVMPQTREAIDHAKAAGVPIVVAINKIDLPAANKDRVKQQLSELDLLPEEWGGKTIFAEISAKHKLGIENLLEMLLLEAEMLELKANPDKKANGVVIEARLDKGRGAVATLLVQDGSMKVSDPIVLGQYWGRVRAMLNDKGQKVAVASPSTPVEVLGLSGVPQAGDAFFVVDSEREAKQISSKRQSIHREKAAKVAHRLSLDDLYRKIQEEGIKELDIIIKTDVQGSCEALKESLEKIGSGQVKVKVKVIHQGVGAIKESDVMLASASNAIIIGFHVRPANPDVKELAEKEGVDMRMYRVIYDVTSDIKLALEGLLEPEIREVIIGLVEVRQLFKVSKIGAIAGSYVKEGKITRGAEARLIRDGVVIYEGKIASLRRFKEDVAEVATGFECGITLVDFQDIKESDIIEVFTTEVIPKKL